MWFISITNIKPLPIFIYEYLTLETSVLQEKSLNWPYNYYILETCFLRKSRRLCYLYNIMLDFFSAIVDTI